MRMRLVLIGMAAGFLSGLFGVGGGVLIVPALVAFCRKDQRQAVAISLLAIAPLAVAGVIGYALHGQVDVFLAIPLALGSMVGAWIGSALLTRAPLRMLRMLFAVVALTAAIRLVVDPGLPSGPVHHDLWRLALLVPVGIAIGVLAGLTGIGGGAVMVPIMQLGFSVAAALAKGTSLLVILPTSLLAAWRNVRAGLGSPRDAAWLGVSGMLAAFGASAISVRLPGVAADLLFGCFLIVVAIRTVWPDLRALQQRTARARDPRPSAASSAEPAGGTASTAEPPSVEPAGAQPEVSRPDAE
jgi:uncharacterized protein